MEKVKAETEKLSEAILEGIQNLKGKEITLIDLESIQHTECSYFIICHGTSSTHVDSIAKSVESTVKENLETDVWHRDGYRNALWILLDYGDIMVHVFQKEAREFYNLEGLWADAKIKTIEEAD
jgi:ribosome-associated protein